MSRQPSERSRPPGWNEAIASALRNAPEPSADLCEKVAALFVGTATAFGKLGQRAPRS